MKENTQEKSLVEINENSIFYRIKTFFRNIFHKSEVRNIETIQEDRQIKEESENRKNAFLEEVRKVEDEETKLLKLQKQYRSGEIKGEELTEEQIKSLGNLYDKQIANEIRKQKLLEYRKKLQTE